MKKVIDNRSTIVATYASVYAICGIYEKSEKGATVTHQYTLEKLLLSKR